MTDLVVFDVIPNYMQTIGILILLVTNIVYFTYKIYMQNQQIEKTDEITPMKEANGYKTP